VGSSEREGKAPSLTKFSIWHWLSLRCVWSNFVTSPSRAIAPAFIIFFLREETNISFPDLGLLVYSNSTTVICFDLSIALNGNPSQSEGASPATRHRWMCPTLTPAKQAGTWFTYPAGMEGGVDLGVGCIQRWFTCPQTVTHQVLNTWKQPDWELNPRAVDRKSNILTVTPPSYRALQNDTVMGNAVIPR